MNNKYYIRKLSKSKSTYIGDHGVIININNITDSDKVFRIFINMLYYEINKNVNKKTTKKKLIKYINLLENTKPDQIQPIIHPLLNEATWLRDKIEDFLCGLSSSILGSAIFQSISNCLK